MGSASRVGEPEGQAEVDGQLEVDVEELGSQQEGVEMGVEVADVESPQHRPLDLGPALPPHLVEVGVVPDVGDRPGEAAVAVEQRRGLGDRPPPVEVVLGVEGEADPDVVAPEPRRRLACPRGRDEEGGAGGQAVAEGVVDAGGGRVAEAEVGAVEDQEAGVGGCPEPLGHGRHAPTVVARPLRRRGPTDRCPLAPVGPAGAVAAPSSRARAAAMPRRPTRRVCSSSRQSSSGRGIPAAAGPSGSGAGNGSAGWSPSGGASAFDWSWDQCARRV